uniref:Uncharacterized protein n=1 Tax=Phlebotomus papatasi TaxID=29031 RepID=A0A1B0D4Z6_PHLPP
PCEPPGQNIPAPPNVGSGATSSGGPSTVAATGTSASSTSPATNSIATNSAIPGTSSSSSSPAGASAATTSASTTASIATASTSSGHQSPYDLRRKSPSASHEVSGCSWNGQTPSSSHHYQSTSIDGGCYMLPARKRPRRTYSTSIDTCTPSAAQYLQYEMPDEVLLTIFSYLLEQDLCRLSLVCKRFNTIANDTELWKRLYQSVYEYDLPLFNPEPCKFLFVKPEDSEYGNPWKESFHQLYRGIHVRPGYQERKYKGRNIAYFNTVQAALDYSDERTTATGAATAAGLATISVSSAGLPALANAGAPAGLPSNAVLAAADEACVAEHPGSLIFLHAGHYRGEFLVIDSDVALIGAAPGNVAESIVLERESESTVMFVEGAKHAYVGHMTLKFSPDVTSTVPHHKHYCLEVGENSSPTIDHCIIRSTSVATYHAIVKGEDTDVTTVMNVILTHDGTGKILHPNPS